MGAFFPLVSRRRRRQSRFVTTAKQNAAKNTRSAHAKSSCVCVCFDSLGGIYIEITSDTHTQSRCDLRRLILIKTTCLFAKETRVWVRSRPNEYAKRIHGWFGWFARDCVFMVSESMTECIISLAT